MTNFQNNALLTTGHASFYDKMRMEIPLNQLYSDMARLPEDQRKDWASRLECTRTGSS